MEESWETGFPQHPDMDYAQEYRACRTMMNLEEEVDEEFLRNIVEKPDPVRSEIILPSQRDETENNDHVMSPRAFVLSFDNSKVEPIITKQEHNILKHRCLSKRIRARHNAGPMSKNKRRSLEEVEDHIMGERRRRQQITEKLIALSATIPSLKKLDKLTILDEAIKYLEQLQERVRVLEKDPSLTSMKRIHEFYENDETVCEVNEVLPKIEVRVSENKQVFMGIYCEKQKAIEFKILSLLENFHLCVTSSSVLPFGKSNLGITIIAQVGDECKTPLNQVVKLLRQIL